MNNLHTMATEMMGTHARRVFSFVQEFHSDPELRARCESDPHGVLAENGFEVPLGYDLRFVADTADVHHFVLPPDPNASLEDDDLDMVVGGKGGAHSSARASGSSSASTATSRRSAYQNSPGQFQSDGPGHQVASS